MPPRQCRLRPIMSRAVMPKTAWCRRSTALYCHAEGQMIYGIGIDLIEIDRIRQALTRTGERFIERVFTELEQQYCRRQGRSESCYAVRFAAKEAFLKAFGTGLRQSM